MSSPAAGGYEVISVEERRRRERARARMRVDEAEDRLREISAETVVLVRTYLDQDVDLDPPLRQGDEPEDLDAHADAVEQLLERAWRLLGEAQAARAEHMLGRAAAGGPSRQARSAGAARADAQTLRPDGSATSDGRREVEADWTPADRRAEAARLAARLPADLSDSERSRIEALAEQHAVGAGGPSSGLVLRQEVQRAVEEAARRQADVSHAAWLRQQLAPFLDQPRAAELDRALAAVTDRSAALSTELRREANSTVERCAQEQDRRFAAAAVAETFRELGYEVEEEFETLAAERGVAHVTRSEWEGYAVRWRLQGDQMRFHVVGVEGRAATPTEATTRDREVQQAWCADLEDVKQHLYRHGLRFAVTEEIGPGQTPVQLVSTVPHTTEHGSRAVRRLREREQGE